MPTVSDMALRVLLQAGQTFQGMTARREERRQHHLPASPEPHRLRQAKAVRQRALAQQAQNRRLYQQEVRSLF